MKALLAQINWQPNSRELRIFSTALACLMLMLTLVGRLYGGEMPEYGPSALSAAVAAVLLGTVCPQTLLWPYRLWMSITTPIFLLVQTLALSLVFYLVFTPVGLFFRLIGRDSLRRKFEPEQTSYWLPHTAPSDRKRYFRQY
ncbi:MAG: hypothetical protein ACI8W8_001078 [Rhodothermales bacterium]